MSGIGGAEIRRDLVEVVILGLEVGLDIDAALGRKGAIPSSGNGPRVDPPLAELTPDMAEVIESPLLVLDLTICWKLAFCDGTGIGSCKLTGNEMGLGLGEAAPP